MRVKILEWKQVDSIGVDKANPESRVSKDGTILHPKPVSMINVELTLDGENRTITIDPPYDRQKVIDKVREEMGNRKQDVGAEFDVTPL